MKDDPERFLATVQVGVTIVGTLASVIGGVAAVEFLKPLLASVPFEPIQNIAEPLAIGIVVVLLSYATLVLGELFPKSIALRHAERIAMMAARPIDMMAKAVSPFVLVLTTSTRFLLHMFGIKEKTDHLFLPEEEIKYYIKEGTAKGVFEKTEAELLHGIFDFADRNVSEIMVSKPNVSAIDINTPSDKVLKFITDTGFSRYPVYKEHLDQIQGVIYNKDVFKASVGCATFDLKSLIRTPYIVPNSIMISRLLREMQRKRVHLAIVVNEHGDVDGIVTIEDILEELVGEIEDEYDIEKGGLVEKLKDGSMLIDASASLRDLVDLGLSFSEEELLEHNTLAGYMLAMLQRMPKGGEFVTKDSMRYTVVDMEKNRIARVKAEKIVNSQPLKQASA